MFILLYTLNIVYICVYNIVPRPVVSVTHLWIHVVYA